MSEVGSQKSATSGDQAELTSDLRPLISGSSIAAAARALVGVRFSHQGRNPDIGLDCAGVLVATFASLGIELKEDPPTYRRLPDESYIRDCLERNFKQIRELTALLAGDILHLKLDRDSAARHLAIVVDGPAELHIIHSTRINGITEEPLRGILTQATIVGVWQFEN